MSTSGREPCLAAVHQDQLLEAMGSGFLMPSRDDVRDGRPVPSMLRLFRGGLPEVAMAGARSGRRHGAVCVLHLAVPTGAMRTLGNGASGVEFPVPISWISCATVPDERALKEVHARAATFPDVVDTSVPLMIGATRLPAPVPRAGHDEPLELNLDAPREVTPRRGRSPDRVPMLEPSGKALLHDVDKVGGAAVGMLWGGFWGVVPDDALAEMSGAITAAGRGGASLFVSMTNLLLRDAMHASDRALLEAAASRLNEADLTDGIDPASFLSECVSASLKRGTTEGDVRRELEDFRSKANDVLASRIELKPELLTDALHVGSRALLVFLLNPTQVGLARFLERRSSTGKTVALLAKMLVGLYSGLAAMPKELKGIPSRLLGQLAELALAYQRGEGFPISVSRSIDARGRRHMAVKVADETLVEASEPGEPRMEKVLGILASLGATTRFDPASGCFVASSLSLIGEREVQVALHDSRVRLPARPCVELTCHIPQPPKALGTKDGLIALLRGAGIGPVWIRMGEQGSPGLSCFVLVEEAAMDEASVRAAVSELRARVTELAPGPKGKTRRASKAPGAAPRKRKPKQGGEGVPPVVNGG